MEPKEDYSRSVFDAADDIAFITTDIHGSDARILDFSPGAEHIFGYRRDEVIGRKFSLLCGDRNQSFKCKLFTQVDPKKPGVTREVFLTRKSGENFPAIFSRYPVYSNGGKLMATLGVAVDITQSKRIERAIKFVNSEFRQLFNMAADGMRVIDKDFNMLRVSETFLKLAGMKKGDAAGKKCYQVLGGPLCHTPSCPLESIFRGERYIEYEVEKTGFDGTRVTCLLTATPFKGLDGEIIGIVEHFKDISIRKRAYEALKKSEMKYNTVVQNSLTGIFLEIDGKIEFANHRLAEILGSPDGRLAGMQMQSLIHPDHLAYHGSNRKKLFSGDAKSAEYEVKCLTLNNQTIWAKILESKIDYEGSDAILGNLVDITARRKMEKALRESEKSLKVLSSHLFTAQEDERKRLAIELHDGIGQTLSAIKFCAENCLKQEENGQSGQGHDFLNKIVSLTKSAIEEVRKISMDLRPSTLDDLGILATIEWFCREFQSLYSSIWIEKRIDACEESVPNSTKTVIFRVIQEALSNVARHSRADLVRLSLRRSEDHLELIIEDNGIGFDQSENQLTRSLIKGFGLAGMRERVEFSGGIFIVMSMKGAGTFLRAKWPVQRSISLR